MTTRFGQDRQEHTRKLRRSPRPLRHRRAARRDRLRRAGAEHAGRPQDRAVPHHVRHGQHLQLPNLYGLYAAIQFALRESRRRLRRALARPRPLPHRRVREHRADSESRKANGDYTKP